MSQKLGTSASLGELCTQSVEIFRTLIEYNYALYGRVWDSIMYLTDEQFVQDVDYSHGSIRTQIVHVAVVDARWWRGLKELPDAREFNLNPSDYPTRHRVRALWDTTSKDILDYVTPMDNVSIARKPQGMGGPVWQVLAHLFNHGTDHRAQILRALHSFWCADIRPRPCFLSFFGLARRIAQSAPAPLLTGPPLRLYAWL